MVTHNKKIIRGRILSLILAISVFAGPLSHVFVETAHAETDAVEYINDGSTYGVYTEYEASSADLKYIAYVCQHEQDNSKAAVACEASYIANKYDKADKSIYPTIKEYVENSGIFPSSSLPAGIYRVKVGLRSYVKSVITKGNRVIPDNVRYTCKFDNIASATNDGVSIDVSDRTQYISGTTKITPTDGETFTFFCWSGESLDPFGPLNGTEVYEGNYDNEDWEGWGDDDNQEMAATVYATSDWNDIFSRGSFAFLYDTDDYLAYADADDVRNLRLLDMDPNYKGEEENEEETKDKEEKKDEKEEEAYEEEERFTVTEYVAEQIEPDYVELVIAILETLYKKNSGPLGNVKNEYDYFGVAKFLPHHSDDVSGNMYAIQLVCHQLKNCFSAYNVSHYNGGDEDSEYVGPYDVGAALYKIVQGVIYGTDYVKDHDYDEYSKESARKYCKSVSGTGLISSDSNNWNSFADDVLSRYTVMKIKGHMFSSATGTGSTDATYGNANGEYIVSGGTATGRAVAEYALQFVGYPYVWGGTSLTNGCDCSGFVMSVYAHFGVSLPHSSSALRSVGTEVSESELAPGDIICFDGHCAIYIGNNQIVHAQSSSTGIVVSSYPYHKTTLTRRRIFTS